MDEVLNMLLEALATTAIKLVVPMLLTLGTLVFRKFMVWINLKLDAEHLAFAREVIREFVMNAEAVGLADQLKLEGAEKKALVLGEAQTYLDSKGIKLNVSVLSSLIESVVLEELNLHKLEGTPRF